MLDKEKRFEKVVSFYQSLPDDLLKNIINALPINRDVRRKINKLKTSKSKVEIRHILSLSLIFPWNLKKLVMMK